jgi:hypothetical protein
MVERELKPVSKILQASKRTVFDAALAQTISEVGKRMATMLHAHQDRAARLIAAVQRTAADLLEIPFRAPEGNEALEVRHDLFWVTRDGAELVVAIAPPVLDRFLPQAMRQVRLRRRLVEAGPLVRFRR